MFLEIHQLKKYFPVQSETLFGRRNFIRAVDSVDLSMSEGENLGLVGESGSGKTTLGRLLLRLYSSDSGRILFEKQDITKLKGNALKFVRKNIQMVFQDPYSSLDPRFTVRNILAETYSLSDRWKPPAEQEMELGKILMAVGLPGGVLSRFAHEFSGGERQRIAIARALLMNPKLLVLDEAVSSLDVLVQEQILDLLKSLQKNFKVTYLFITHNLRVVRKLCQRVAVMYKGKIVEIAETEEIIRNPLHPYTRMLLAAAVDYRPAENISRIEIRDGARLLEKTAGHYVID